MVQDNQVPEQKKFSIAVYCSRKCHTSIEANLFSNASKECVNEIDNAQEKNIKKQEWSKYFETLDILLSVYFKASEAERD